MSKSLDNYMGINESPKEIHDKIISMPDDLIISYFELTTDVSNEELNSIKEALSTKKDTKYYLKKQLAHKLIEMYCDGVNLLDYN